MLWSIIIESLKKVKNKNSSTTLANNIHCGVGETLESPLDCKEIQPVHPKRDQSWVFIGRTDVEAETPVLWLPDANSWLIWKDPDAGEDWGQEERGTTEDEMVGWHHWLNGHGFGWALGVGDEQRGLACCNSWGLRVTHDWAAELNWYTVICVFSAFSQRHNACLKREPRLRFVSCHLLVP